MVQFNTTILQFAEQGEKTRWMYILVPAPLAQQLKPNNKKTFRVKGLIDTHPIKGIALLPMGNGDFIIALNASMRKAIRKTKGAKIQVQLNLDKEEPKPPAVFFECLQDEPQALDFFNSLSKSHQNYFSNWINAAKTEATRTSRIAKAISALAKKHHYGLMLRALQAQKEKGIGK